MYTRFLSAGLWFFAAVYAGSILHGVAGMHEIVGPLVGLTTAGLIVAVPTRRYAAKPAASLAPIAPATGAMQTQV
jgi:hypothetical protein